MAGAFDHYLDPGMAGFFSQFTYKKRARFILYKRALSVF